MRFVSLLLILVCSLSAQVSEKDIVAEFQRNIRNPEPAVRRDQIERLAKVPSLETLKLAVQHGAMDADPSVQDAAARALAAMGGADTRVAFFQLFEDRRNLVQRAASLAVVHLSPPPSAAEFPAIRRLLDERDADLVESAVTALATLGDRDSIPRLLELAGDRRDIVSVALADGLGLLGGDAVGPALTALLRHPAWQVQVAAIQALGRVRSKPTIPALIDYLSSAEGRPRDDARRALERITLRTLGERPEAWRQFWKIAELTWVVPPLESGQAVEEVAEPKGREGYDTAETNKPHRYHRMELKSRRLLFVIDVSSSMLDRILVKEGVVVQAEKSDILTTAKLELARAELARVLDLLEAHHEFNVIAFETDIRIFRPDSVQASPGNVLAAKNWLRRQNPAVSAGTGRGLRQSGGTNAAGQMLGRTNTYGALRATFGLPLTGTVGRTTSSPGRLVQRPRWDSVYFLSDGRPTEGEVTDIPTILEHVREWNRSSRLVINTIGMESEQGLRILLDGLAAETGGQSVYVGR